MNSKLRKELEHIALDEASSGRARLAKVQALRLLERLDREADGDDIPVDDDGRFHPGPSSMWGLDRADSDETRAQWLRNWLVGGRR